MEFWMPWGHHKSREIQLRGWNSEFWGGILEDAAAPGRAAFPTFAPWKRGIWDPWDQGSAAQVRLIPTFDPIFPPHSLSSALNPTGFSMIPKNPNRNKAGVWLWPNPRIPACFKLSHSQQSHPFSLKERFFPRKNNLEKQQRRNSRLLSTWFLLEKEEVPDFPAEI